MTEHRNTLQVYCTPVLTTERVSPAAVSCRMAAILWPISGVFLVPDVLQIAVISLLVGCGLAISFLLDGALIWAMIRVITFLRRTAGK